MYFSFVRIFHKYLDILFKIKLYHLYLFPLLFKKKEKKNIFLVSVRKASLLWVMSTYKHAMLFKESCVVRTLSPVLVFFLTSNNLLILNLQTQTKLNYTAKKLSESNLNCIP